MYKGNVIVRPLLTEQTMREVEKDKYTFIVNRGASKTMVQKIVEEKFGVNVLAVTTSLVKGRTKRVGQRRVEVTNGAFKKATLTLKKGQKIDLFTVGK